MTEPAKKVSQNDGHWLSVDPMDWNTGTSDALCIACDWGFSHDHAAMVTGGIWASRGVPHVGIINLHRFPHETAPTDVLNAIAEELGSLPAIRQPAVVLDARNNIPMLHAALGMGLPVVGVSATNAAVHATRPSSHPVPAVGRAAHIWSLSRNALVEDVIAHLGGSLLHITDKAQASSVLRDEMSSLDREITDSGNIRYRTQSGAHDDVLMAMASVIWALSNISFVNAAAGIRSRRTAGGLGAHVSADGWT